jgi:hypothetical protein
MDYCMEIGGKLVQFRGLVSNAVHFVATDVALWVS